ncbi:MAG: phage tail fiber protein [Thermodesulfobacteriota bacterium]
MAKFCDEGENWLADVAFKKDTSPPTNLYLGLYTNTTEPAEDATLAAITEPSGNGYARQAIACGGDVTLAGGQVTAAQKTFAASGGAWGNVYGYFLATTIDGTGKLLAVEQFSDGPYNVVDQGSVKVTARLTIS